MAKALFSCQGHVPTCLGKNWSGTPGVPTCLGKNWGGNPGVPTCLEENWGGIPGIPTCLRRRNWRGSGRRPSVLRQGTVAPASRGSRAGTRAQSLWGGDGGYFLAQKSTTVGVLYPSSFQVLAESQFPSYPTVLLKSGNLWRGGREQNVKGPVLF